MNNFYSLLYLPLGGLLLLCLRGGWKFAEEWRQHSRETWVRTGGALLAVMLFTASYAVMVVTHARSFNLAMLPVGCMGIVNLLRNGFPRAKA